MRIKIKLSKNHQAPEDQYHHIIKLWAGIETPSGRCKVVSQNRLYQTLLYLSTNRSLWYKITALFRLGRISCGATSCKNRISITVYPHYQIRIYAGLLHSINLHDLQFVQYESTAQYNHTHTTKSAVRACRYSVVDLIKMNFRLSFGFTENASCITKNIPCHQWPSFKLNKRSIA